MRDFFMHISGNNNVCFRDKAMDFFNALFPESINSYKIIDNIIITYSCDSEDELGSIPLVSKTKKAFFFIAGDYTLPESLLPTDRGKGEKVNLLLSLFELYEGKLFEKLSGHFNAVICYPEKKEIKVINSKLGLYPLYYSYFNGELLLSTRLGIFKNIFDKSNTNLSVIMQYCLYNYPVSSGTFIKGVSLLPAASVLTFVKQELSINRYWQTDELENEEKIPRNFDESVDLLDDTLNSIIGHKCASVVRTGISFTGGWDGRLILAYVLKHIQPEQILLYSHGTGQNPDILLPCQTAKNLKFNYVPVLLDDPVYKETQLKWIEDTIKYSDGLRQISRLHYLYNMDFLNKEYGIDHIISGNGGSNLLKSTNIHPCDVFNKYVIDLVGTDNFELTLKNHFDHCLNLFPEFSKDVEFEIFMSSFDYKYFRELNLIKDKTDRFFRFLLNEVERKYFGPELQSYKHLVKNFSPFFEDEFIKALRCTVFFTKRNSTGLGKSYYNSRLYSNLILRNNRLLAKEPTDRGFSMYEAANPFLFPVMATRYLIKRLKKPRSVDYFNNKDILNRYFADTFPNIKLLKMNSYSNRLFLENYLSAQAFLNIPEL